jgi:two-component system chemotaxis response regulator CheY
LKHCLVVDDSRVIRKIACRILEELHFATDEAENVASALDVCRTRMPDAILLDAQLPQSGGLDFLRHLRRSSNGAHPTVIVCTTENNLPHIVEAMEAGANDFVMKPFDRGVIEEKLAHFGLL